MITVLAVVGALFMYFPTIYGGAIELLPHDTTQSLPAVEAVENVHAQVISPETRTKVEKIVANRWMDLKEKVEYGIGFAVKQFNGAKNRNER
jgi:hypothetical protein